MSFNNSEKYEHLNNIAPEAEKVLDTPVHLINDEDLSVLDEHLLNLQKKFGLKNPEMNSAAEDIRNKISGIVDIGKSKVSGEIMKAANDENYKKVA